jgi:CDP-diacylglycerol---glycerol-3-phosphate 3-phosphatidyltransferase
VVASRINLPNALTVGRIFLVPLLVVVLLTKFEGRQILGLPKELVAAAIFGLGAFTDWLDGYLARRRQQVTTLGQLLDPLADKLLVTAAFVSLVQLDLAPAWMVAVILGREFAVTILRSLAHARGVVISASPLGKFKMVSQVVAILLLILGDAYLQAFAVLGTIALWIAVITAVVSGVDYYRRFSHVLGRAQDGARAPEEPGVSPSSSPSRRESPRPASALPPGTRSSRTP